MVRLDRIYTRGGDGGQTSLGDGSRVAKNALRIAALGDVDESNAAIGVARTLAPARIDGMLARIQGELFDLGADLCLPRDRPGRPALRVAESQIRRLEGEIDEINAGLAPLTSFVLPAGNAAAAQVHLARAVVRRAERSAAALAAAEQVSPPVLAYLNRLSDLLFVLARHLNSDGERDVTWVPGATR